MITSNADLSQGFSFKRGKGSDVVYEHQLSVSILYEHNLVQHV
jgi:predicted RNA binding protein YcfA (HicA-like mRNA interferase family)